MKGESLEPTSLLNSLENIWKCSLGVVKDTLQLLILEIILAGKSIAALFILIGILFIFSLSSWLALLSALTIWLMSFKISLTLALFTMSALNLILAIVVSFYMIRISHNLQFKEIRAQLGFTKGDNNEADAT